MLLQMSRPSGLDGTSALCLHTPTRYTTVRHDESVNSAVHCGCQPSNSRCGASHGHASTLHRIVSSCLPLLALGYEVSNTLTAKMISSSAKGAICAPTAGGLLRDHEAMAHKSAADRLLMMMQQSYSMFLRSLAELCASIVCDCYAPRACMRVPCAQRPTCH